MQTESKPVAPSRIYRPPSYVERLDLGHLFPVSQPLEVELGSGDGSFLAQWATQHPDRNFLGVERLLGRLRKLDRKGRRANLANLRVLRIEASYCLAWLLPRCSVQALHVYFPDPWPKRRHWKNRLVNAEFVAAAAAALALDGAVFFRTDNEDYFNQIRNVFETHAAFEPTVTPADLSDVLTDFERDFHARGVTTLRVAYRKGTDRSRPG
jgi:tRNA (guanine-N7-)-methyltransferase